MHAYKTPRLFNISKMQLYFRNRKYSQDCCQINTPTRQNSCEYNERITRFNDKILDFLNVCGLYVIMHSVNFGMV